MAVVTEGRLRLCETADDLLAVLELFCHPISLTQTDGLRELRQKVKQESLRLGLSEERCHDLVTASQEAGMNAVVHVGGGLSRISTNGRNTVQVRVEDGGTGINVEHLPRTLLEKGYSTAGTLGYGMKMMILSADRIWLLTGQLGTTVVLEQDHTTLKHTWL
ncbi:MAG: ATP-binding protein [Janthinobacterium lividum]